MRPWLITAVALATLALAAAADDVPRGAPLWLWQLPFGFPVPQVPATNPLSAAKVELGRRLFYDPRLSGSGTVACATCHRQELAFTDGRGRAVGETGEQHPRGAMSLANVAYAASLTWADPSLRALEDQVLVPLMAETPIEMGVRGREAEILARLEAEPIYRQLFGEAFSAGTPISWPAITRAIAAFERVLISGDSAYDRFVYHDQPLPPAAARGRLVFFERLECQRCHAGFTFSGPVVSQTDPDAAPVFVNTGLYDLPDGAGGRGAYPPDNQGLFAHTGNAADMGAFRAPTLRNIAVTAPYMHDGSLATLDEVIDHYAAGGRTPNRHKSPLLVPFTLSAGERTDLVAFLESLTDTAFLTEPRLADPWQVP